MTASTPMLAMDVLEVQTTIHQLNKGKCFSVLWDEGTEPNINSNIRYLCANGWGKTSKRESFTINK